MAGINRPLTDKVALVTGGSRGIGKAICNRLAEAGAHVILTYANSTDQAKMVEEACRSHHVKAETQQVDAGDIGAGHKVTAIYEITPVGSDAVAIDPSRYASDDMAVEADDVEFDNEYAFLKIRYKLPKESKSKLITTPVTADMDAQLDPVGCGTEDRCPAAVSDDVRFSIAVAGFGQLLKDDKYLNDFDYDDAVLLAKKGKGADEYGYRSELIQLIRAAKTADQMER